MSQQRETVKARVTAKARVTGRVQGVGYRAWVQREAQRLGLEGWVRNEADGSVAMLIEGPPERVSEMLALLWKGPPAASVAGVESEEAAPEGPLTGFQIRR